MANDPEETVETPSQVRLGYRFAAVPEWIVFSGALNPTDVRVFAALARYTGADRTCYPSAATIASKIDKSERTVRYSLKALEDAGAITVQHRRTTSIYTLAGDTPLQPVANQARQLVAGQARQPVADEREPVERETPLPPIAEPESVVIVEEEGPPEDRREQIAWRLERRFGAPGNERAQKVRDAQVQTMMDRGWEPVEVSRRAVTLLERWPTVQNPIAVLISRWDDWAPLTPGQMYGV